MDNQRLRNLTTRRLHTEMGHIYQDVEFITGSTGVMTHMLPNAMRAMSPWLGDKVTDARFWDGKYDPSHEGETELHPMDESERKEFWRLYGELPSPFANLGTNR